LDRRSTSCRPPIAPQKCPMAEIRTPSTEDKGRFAGICIGVSDLQRSVRFYTEALGMQQQTVYDLPHMREVIVSYSDDILIGLMQFKGTQPNCRDNLVKIALFLEDPWTVADKIRARGCEITREPTPMPEWNNMIVGFAKDPDGYVIEMLKKPVGWTDHIALAE